MDFDIRPHTQLLVKSGSRAYGMATATSDLDVKGVAFAPKSYYLGCMFTFAQAEGPEHIKKFLDIIPKEDVVNGYEGTIYEIKKALTLFVKNNPSMLDILYVRDQDVYFSTKIGELLREFRDGFLNIKAYWAYSKYSRSQLDKIESHRSWMKNPLEEQPLREDFGLTEAYPIVKLNVAIDIIKKKMDGWQLDLGLLDKADRLYVREQIEELLAEQTVVSADDWRFAARAVGFGEDMMRVLELEYKYRKAYADWKKYQDWKRKRNPERAALEMKYGYDCKFAVHLVRLMRQCREILTTGKVRVWRGDIDADELMAIRNGVWTYDKLVEYAHTEDAALRKIHDEGSSVLPQKPDVKGVDKLCQRIFEEYLKG